MARQVREGWPGFSTGLPALTKRDRHPCRSPCGPDRPTLTAAQGPLRSKASGSCRWRGTSHRRSSGGFSVGAHLYATSLRSSNYVTLRWRTSALLQGHRGRKEIADAASGALRAPLWLWLSLLTSGPLWRGGRVEEQPAGWPAGMPASFSSGQEALSKNPVTRPRTFRAISPEGAPSGWPFSWLLLFGHAKRSDPLSGRTAEARRRRAKSRERYVMAKEQSHWMTSLRLL